MTEEQAKTFQWNPFDLTKVWPHNEYPLMEIGILELNRNPENYFAEVEQAAFSPSVFVPGIGPSPDKVLQARLMSYPDAQRYRIGTNYQQLPRQPASLPSDALPAGWCHVHRLQAAAAPIIIPTATEALPKEAPQYREPGLSLGDVVADRYESRDQDDYTQAGNLWRIFSEDEKNRTAQAIARSAVPQGQSQER
jgi:catalase